MSTVKLTITCPTENCQSVLFTSPCASQNCTGILIGTQSYDLVDSLGRSILGKPNFFSAGSILSTRIDVTNHKLYLQNTSNLVLSDDSCQNLGIPNGSTVCEALGGMKLIAGPEVIECTQESSKCKVTLTEVYFGTQFIIEVPLTTSEIYINSIKYSVVNSSGSSASMTKDSVVLLTLDPEDKKAYI